MPPFVLFPDAEVLEFGERCGAGFEKLSHGTGQSMQMKGDAPSRETEAALPSVVARNCVKASCSFSPAAEGELAMPDGFRGQRHGCGSAQL